MVAIEQIPGHHRAKSLNLFLKILLQIGARPESGHTFSPFVMKDHFDNMQCYLISKYQLFFDAMLNTIGLRLEVEGTSEVKSAATEKAPIPTSDTPKPEPKKTEKIEPEEEFQGVAPASTIKFSIKYPLSVYTIICSSLMEFYADQKFVTTGKWERPIYA